MDLDKLLGRRLPDPLVRIAVRTILKQKTKKQAIGSVEERLAFMADFVTGLKAEPIAIHTEDANEQHYELPPQFFQAVLGRMLKYSCGYWKEPLDITRAHQGLDQSEMDMLQLTCRRAEVSDGQEILDLGCGWGSSALYMAEVLPSAKITAISNSKPQIEYIQSEAERKGFRNIIAFKKDINDLELPQKFDRVVTVEMFEHMRNYEVLLEKVSGFMKPKGKLFIHIFSHHSYPFLYENRSGRDWMARHFFTGGTMPSQDLLHYFLDHFYLKKQWAVSGIHYRMTLEAWLQIMDQKRDQIFPLFEATYGQDEAEKWWNYWRLFFLTCAEFFGFRGGNEWFVSHYLLSRR